MRCVADVLTMCCWCAADVMLMCCLCVGDVSLMCAPRWSLAVTGMFTDVLPMCCWRASDVLLMCADVLLMCCLCIYHCHTHTTCAKHTTVSTHTHIRPYTTNVRQKPPQYLFQCTFTAVVLTRLLVTHMAYRCVADVLPMCC